MPRTPEELIATGAEIMADYLDPESGMSKDDVIKGMTRLFDSPIAIEAYEREMTRRAGGRDADRWH